ncbi:hypothetical protein SDC9_207514 [bioreactor metagenome]|uniref:MurNAc-LAA domain-containing protein n=1 Tax=bioreactor metagenome TaxID=1076179 RepID=A0A645J9L4_9ZZZZ
MHDTLVNGIGTNDRGIVPSSDLSVLQRAEMPSILIELGFLSNKKDADNLKTESFKQKTAESLAEGIEKALSKIDE